MTLHILGAAHTGAEALWQALAERLGPLAGHLHPPPGAVSDGAPALVVLMGLDWPCPAAEQPQRAEQDAQLRQGLALRGIAYRVLYGPLERRLASVLSALGESRTPPPAAVASAPPAPNTENTPDTRARLRAWGCEKCSDPVCEHRLFTSLKLTPTV
jgi:hypothetical protein